MPETRKDGSNPSKIDPADQIVGRRIRERRNFLGVSQQALCNSAGLTLDQLRSIERGSTRARASLLLTLASALAVPMTHFLARPPLPPAGPNGAGPGRGKDKSATNKRATLKSIRAQYKSAGPEDRRRLQELARELSARRARSE